ncbi:MAG: DUF58 domain-containing protein [Desulfobacterales bacterium]|nr:DUF58 domain-containing protein [Desulfobacterales bacterium]
MATRNISIAKPAPFPGNPPIIRLMRRLWLSLLQILLTRITPLWRIERPSEDGIALIQPRHPLALVALVFVFLWYIARPSPVAVVAAVGLGGLLGAGYFWARCMAFGLSAKRHLNYAAVQVGDEIEESVTLVNRSILPVLYAEFNDQSNIPGYSLSSVRAADSSSSQEWRVHAVCTLRGNYRFGPWQLLTGDPFGLFRVTLTYRQQEEILVYPPLAALPEEILPRGRAQGDDRPLLLPLLAESMSALSTRPYAPGDALRRIHWPTSARQAAPFVKVFDPEAASTLWLIPDLDRAVQRGAGSDSTLETMITLLASLAEHLLNQRLAVGLIAYAQSPVVILPARGRAQFWQILRQLAELQPVAHPFAETLAQARTLISGRQRLLAVTPSLAPEWAGQLARLGPAARRSGAEVILLDPHSFDVSSPQMGDDAASAPQIGDAASPLRRHLGGSASALHAPTGEPQGNNASESPQGDNAPHPPLEAGAYISFLASLGVPAHLLRQGDIRPYTASYGELSRWEFQTLGTGRAFARHAPRPRLDEHRKNIGGLS